MIHYTNNQSPAINTDSVSHESHKSLWLMKLRTNAALAKLTQMKSISLQKQ